MSLACTPQPPLTRPAHSGHTTTATSPHGRTTQLPVTPGPRQARARISSLTAGSVSNAMRQGLASAGLAWEGSLQRGWLVCPSQHIQLTEVREYCCTQVPQLPTKHIVDMGVGSVKHSCCGSAQAPWSSYPSLQGCTCCAAVARCDARPPVCRLQVQRPLATGQTLWQRAAGSCLQLCGCWCHVGAAAGG